MKLLVNLIQYSLILVLVLPLLYLWETDSVKRFCRQVSPGMNQQTYQGLLSEQSLKYNQIIEQQTATDKWQMSITTHLPSDYRCQITGLANRVTDVEFIDSES